MGQHGAIMSFGPLERTCRGCLVQGLLMPFRGLVGAEDHLLAGPASSEAALWGF